MTTISRHVGISKIKITDFKALRNVELNLKPLSYLLGENSLGKSSVTQALRLLAQNIRDSDPQNFKLNLPGLKLGQFEKVVSSSGQNGFFIELAMNLPEENKTSVSDEQHQRGSRVRAHINLDEPSMARTMNDMILEGILAKKEVTVVSRPGMRTRIPLQWFFITLNELRLAISPTFVGQRRWVQGQIGEIDLPTGTYIEFKEKNFFTSISAGITSSYGNAAFKSPLLVESDFDFLFNWDFEEQELDGRAKGKVLNLSLKDALMLHISIQKHLADESSDSEYTGGQIYGPDLIPSFKSFLRFPLVTVRDVVRDRGSDFSGDNDQIRALIHTHLMFEEFEDTDHYVWREDVDVANDASLDSNFYWVTVDTKTFDFRDVIDHLAHRDLMSNVSRFYDFWVNPISNKIKNEVITRIQESLAVSSELVTKNIHYVGPLRGDGYTTQIMDKELDSFLPVGLVGEQLVQVLVEDAESSNSRNSLRNNIELLRAADGKISDWKPVYRFPKANGYSDNSLLKALESWINFFELGTKLEISDLGVLGLQVFIDGKNLYHLGSGVSQILPVLTACLLAEPGSLTIIEQPELHLHPAAQQKLADFFLVMSQSGRNLLIETHSEYMINRTRRDVALSKADAKDIQLFFAERGDDETTIREANLTGSGGFEYWPKGFFSQTEEDLLEILRNLE